MYNWQHKTWPNFKYSLDGLEGKLIDITSKVNLVAGAVSSLPQQLQTETLIQTLMAEALKTSEIEREFFSRKDVMSSIKKNLGLKPEKSPVNKNAIGLGKMLLDVRNSFNEPLTEKKLFDWHSFLDRKSTRLNSSHIPLSRMPSSA